MEKLLIPILSVFGTIGLAASTPIIVETVRKGIKSSNDHFRKLALLALLRAEFGHIARHSATNLKRLTENFRSAPTISEFRIVVRKISLRQTDIDSKEALLSAVKINELALLPENLARDAMRIQLRTRNTEIDIESTLEEMSTLEPAEFYGPKQMRDLEYRLSTLSKSVERTAQDSAALVEKLRNYELSIVESGILWRTRKILTLPVRIYGVRWLLKELGQLASRVSGASERNFKDEPIHFEDVMNLREVGDWKSWKEEQILISAEDVENIFRGCMTSEIDEPRCNVRHQNIGTINLISHVEAEDKEYCLRTRINEPIFQYEKRLVKDVVVALALAKIEPTPNDHTFLLSECINLTSRSHGGNRQGKIQFPLGPDIYYFSNLYQLPDGRNLPVTITDWINDPLLGDDLKKEKFFAVGKSIARLHEIKICNYYRNFRDLGFYRFARNFSEEVTSEISTRLLEIDSLSGSQISKTTDFFRQEIDEIGKNEQYTVCHNDLHVNNIFVSSEGVVNIIDWDNACIHHRYFDFVKMKYWGDVGADGKFRENNAYFAQYCAGYGIDVKQILDSSVFQALSLLWLLRVYAFESKREALGQPIPAPFLPSEYYLERIRKLIKNVPY